LKTSDAFKLIVQIESSVDTDVFIWKGFNTWPLIRQILWVELTSTASNDKTSKKGSTLEIFASIKKIVLAIYYSFSEAKISQDNTKIFISRPVYLQELHSKKYFDRIVDPIIELFGLNEKITKFYVSNVPNKKELMHEFLTMQQSFFFDVITLTNEQKRVLHQIDNLSNIYGLKFLSPQNL